MTDPIALAVAFSENLETKFLNISKVFEILSFQKSHILSANFSEIIRKFFDDGS